MRAFKASFLRTEHGLWNITLQWFKFNNNNSCLTRYEIDSYKLEDCFHDPSNLLD